MFKTLLVGGIALMGVVVVGCEASEIPDIPLEDAEVELRAAVCDRVIECGCRDVQYANIEECHEDVDELVTELYANVDTLEYNPSCMGYIVQRFLDLGCSPDADRPTFNDPPCWLLNGDKQAGDSCNHIRQAATECAPGLYCRAGICTDVALIDTPPVQAALGEPCPDRWCEGGSYCNANSICQRLPTVGEPCWSRECYNARCESVEDEWVCVPRIAEGEQCRGHSQCATGYCPAGFCLPRPKLGEECFNVCVEGLVCSDNVCVPPNGAVCEARLPR
ncbi:MAG: hypothetical protein AAF799_37145 [Myxococcota bacterium]